MADSHGLEPPLPQNLADPEAHQLADASDSEDQFMDAQSIAGSSNPGSPVPEVQAQEVGDGDLSGEEPPYPATGNLTDHEAEVGETTVVPAYEAEDEAVTPMSQGPVPVPMTAVEELLAGSPDEDVAETRKRTADASPDILPDPDGEIKAGGKADSLSDPPSISNSAKAALSDEVEEQGADDHSHDHGDNLGDGFDDDFDDFEEGGGEQNEDFDDFQDDFQQPQTSVPSIPAPPCLPQSTLPFSIPDFDGLSPDEVISAIDPCLSHLFPPEELVFPPFPSLDKEYVFLTPRSASLWSQLVAPPPLAPPDWIRSHTRRLFLVSLGVPVDLDEILPASKQKKLVLPSLHTSSTSPHSPGDVASSARLNQEDRGNTLAASGDEQDKTWSSGKRKGPPPEPPLDLVAAKHLCQTTDEALDGMTTQELQEHVAKLEAMQGIAQQVLEYWTKRADEKIGDREAFEGVIENLVAHARKVRK